MDHMQPRPMPHMSHMAPHDVQYIAERYQLLLQPISISNSLSTLTWTNCPPLSSSSKLQAFDSVPSPDHPRFTINRGTDPIPFRFPRDPSQFLPCPCLFSHRTITSMSCSQSNLPAYHPLPAYTAEPRRGYEQRILINETPNVPLSVPSPPRQWRDQFVKQSKSGGVTLKVSNQRPNVQFPIYHGGTNNPVRGCVDLAKTENVTSVELKECTISIQLSHLPRSRLRGYQS